MIVHTFLVICMTLNPTMCREQEIIPDTYERTTSGRECGQLGFSAMGAGFTDLDGVAWRVTGVRCKTQGSIPTTSIQAYLRDLVRE